MRRPVVLSLILIAACNEHPLKNVEYGRFSGDSVTIAVDPHRDVDILFVIDNSGSMGEEQATLAANFEAFIDVLEDPDVDANYRIAITTTDNGHPQCSGTGPEAGNFVLSSCWSRLSQFQSPPNAAEPVDARAVACTDLCPEELADLESEPTTIDGDASPEPRPWLERIGHVTNLPEDVDAATAFACFGPQGVDGCGYESTLETMYKALIRAEDAEQDEVGFLRDEALLAVVFVTDEADCSLRTGMESVFSPDGDRALWADAGAVGPTSAVCWNAGTSCTSNGDGTLDCVAADIGPDGQPTDEDSSVLLPLSRYIDKLQVIEDRKRELTGNVDLDVLVSVIGGVPTGGGEVVYQRGVDAEFEDNFGIAPGCHSANGEAVPPARLLEVAAAFAGEEENVYSVCDSDYTGALREIARRLSQEFKPACADLCPQDVDRVTDGLQDNCIVSETTPNGESTVVPDCVQSADGAFALPEGADVCVFIATADERDEACVENLAPVEFVPVYREGAPRKAGATLSATCSVSDNARLDCPWI